MEQFLITSLRCPVLQLNTRRKSSLFEVMPLILNSGSECKSSNTLDKSFSSRNKEHQDIPVEIKNSCSWLNLIPGKRGSRPFLFTHF